jgi:hypothetical protein
MRGGVLCGCVCSTDGVVLAVLRRGRPQVPVALSLPRHCDAPGFGGAAAAGSPLIGRDAALVGLVQVTDRE